VFEDSEVDPTFVRWERTVLMIPDLPPLRLGAVVV